MSRTWLPCVGCNEEMPEVNLDADQLSVTCAEGAKLEEQVGQCGHGPEVMCRECHPEAFDNAPRSPVYYHAECGCELKDDTKIKWCPYHVSGLQETINVRERELRELRDERNEWKAKAEHLERMLDSAEKKRAAYANDRDYWKDVARKARQHEDEALKALTQRTHYCCMHMRWETREGAEV